MAITGFLRQMALLHHRRLYILHNEKCIGLAPLLWFKSTWFGMKEGWCPYETSPMVRVGRGVSVEKQHAGMNRQLMLHLWHLSRTLVSDVTLFCSVEVIQKFPPPAPLKSETAMSYGAEAPSLRRARAAINGNGSARRVTTRGEGPWASRAAPTGQPLISNDWRFRSWPLAVLEYIIHCYRCVQYRIDKAIDTLKTHHKHKHIALNVRLCLNYGWTIIILTWLFFSFKWNGIVKTYTEGKTKANINTIFIAFVSKSVLRCF